MIGDIVGSTIRIPSLAVTNTMGPRIAAAKTLSAYLAGAQFVVRGEDADDRTFQLSSVRSEWPSPSEDLDYPTASIIEAGSSDYDAHNLVPTALEDTLGDYDCLIGDPVGDPPTTVLWKEGELATTFQLDFWTASKPEREAIEGRLGQLFAPSEERTGVLLVGPDEYYGRSVRATLMGTRHDDAGATAYPNEWRLRCIVRVEIDIVSLRLATLMQPTQVCLTVADPNDPEE